MKAVNLKFDIHMNNGLMYHVYKNQGQGPIALEVTSLDGFLNLPLMKNVCYRFLRNYKS